MPYKGKIRSRFSEPALKDQRIRVLLVEDRDADAILVHEALRKGDGIGVFDLNLAKSLMLRTLQFLQLKIRLLSCCKQ